MDGEISQEAVEYRFTRDGDSLKRPLFDVHQAFTQRGTGCTELADQRRAKARIPPLDRENIQAASFIVRGRKVAIDGGGFSFNRFMFNPFLSIDFFLRQADEQGPAVLTERGIREG